MNLKSFLSAYTGFLIVLTGVLGQQPLFGAAPKVLSIDGIVPWQVVQREGGDPVEFTGKQPRHDNQGYADVLLTCKELPKLALPPTARWEYQVTNYPQSQGLERAWQATRIYEHPDAPELAIGLARISAGGWYRLNLQCRDGENILAVGTIEPIAVGEVILVAGQSYSTNCNDERLTVSDPEKRVVAFDYAKNSWAVANDPQPAPDGSDGGSIWPPVGERLLKEFGVPIAFANVGVGATSTAQWLPEGPLHQRLREVGQRLGKFRAVLWQQGESDVLAQTTTDGYVANMRLIEKAASDAWKFQPHWLLAKSTHHPTVYDNPTGENAIRSAVDSLATSTPFMLGPDTDTLRGENRGGINTRRHFSAIGQQNAAKLWSDTLIAYIRKPITATNSMSRLLSDLNLWAPCWSSEIVYRESSVLLQEKVGTTAIARLAFPAKEVLAVTSASGSVLYSPEVDYQLSSDGLTLMFTHPRSIEPIAATDFFPAPDSPNSYKHRAGHPEQNMLYRPGRWFHDHDVEVTYRKLETNKDAALTSLQKNVITGSLPKTTAILKAKKPLTLGASGDSISTGADASGIAKTAPFQPGYVELVAAQLQETYQSPVTLKNRAVGGWSVANGVQDLDNLLAEKPDLIIVAYGMNDVGRRDPNWYREQTKNIIDRIHAANADTEIILVATMLGHSEWVHTPREMFARYRDELRSLVAPGVALADLTEVWSALLENKHDFDLTGNGLNHPNDFGHRLYAQAILSLLKP